MQDRNPGLSELMRKANRGDARSYDELLRSLPCVVRRMVTRGAPRDVPLDEEDIVQETLLAIHTKRHTWDETRPLLPWVHAVARHKLADVLRRQHGYSVSIDDMSEELSVPHAAHCHGVDALSLLRFLKGRTRDIVAAISIDGASTREVAAKLGMTEVAVRVAYHRALNSLARAVAVR